MYPIRKNFYNSDIMMIRYEKLFSLLTSAKEPVLKEQIKYLIELCEETTFRQDEFPYDLSAWSSPSFGLSITDKRNFSIVELAQTENLEDSIFLGEDELWTACGYAFVNGDLGIANDLKKIKELNSSFTSLKVKDCLQVAEASSLSYLLSFKETKCNIDKDKKIIFFDGNKFILVYTGATLDREETWDLKRGRILKYKKYKSLNTINKE